MIQRFPIASADTAPAGHDITPSHKIITGQNPSPSHWPNKKTDSARGLGLPNTLPRESTHRNLLKRKIIRANIETTLLIQPPPQNIIGRIRGTIGIKLDEEGSYHFHFPVIEMLNKANIPIHPPFWQMSTESIVASWLEAHANNVGNNSFNGASPHHQSGHKRTLVPSPTRNSTCWAKLSQPGIMPFQRPQPWDPRTIPVHQLPLVTPYRATTTRLHKRDSSNPNLHSHLPNKALLNSTRFRTPNHHN